MNTHLAEFMVSRGVWAGVGTSGRTGALRNLSDAAGPLGVGNSPVRARCITAVRSGDCWVQRSSQSKHHPQTRTSPICLWLSRCATPRAGCQNACARGKRGARADLCSSTSAREMSTPGVEPGLSRPRRDVLTTRRWGRWWCIAASAAANKLAVSVGFPRIMCYMLAQRPRADLSRDRWIQSPEC